MTVLLTISFVEPHLLNDRNKFLANFVNHELLGTLGFIVAVTLASAASVHFELNKIEDQTGKPFLRTRSSLKRSAYSLIVLFGAAGVIVIVKPLLPSPDYNRAVANSLAIGIIFFNLSVLLDLTRTVFRIPSAENIKRMGTGDPA
ncbi:hypothetical protein [Sphingopyxis sp. H115]|uniref:hypothetical protein n=1 Tax=Sphingopyxis sp. H115 TaxID=1759073 RepID=UPI00128F05F6|nr:hypothetical protein [Sphingopyxis sp. H115]